MDVKVGDWVYITSSLNKGILKRKVKGVVEGAKTWISIGSGYLEYALGVDAFLSEAEAITDFEKRKTARIQSLKRSLAKAEKLQPKIKEPKP